METNLRSSLAVFRIVFGVLMLFSVLRSMLKGWVKTLYIDPTYYFTYYGFEWVKPLGSVGMYLLFGVMIISLLGIILGLYYRLNTSLFFIAFTYVELIDKSNYLNHYYLISLISFLLIFIPTHSYFSLDCLRKPALLTKKINLWSVDILKIQIGMVYVFAGLAKLNSDWLLEALPLKIWLPAKANVPLIGSWFLYEEVAYLFSWFGAIYDLLIVFFLLYKPTRLFAYALVIIFHILTAILFPIGVFPYVMIGLTLIFFSPDFHQKIIAKIQILLRKIGRFDNVLKKPKLSLPNKSEIISKKLSREWIGIGLSLYLIWQLALPFRHLLYPDKLFWTEEGYRFSWRVMLMEKAGQAFFYVKDLNTNSVEEVRNSDYLTPHQEQMMATQPDMILQFAHYLKEVYARKGITNIAITTECYVTLNGRMSQLLIDPNTDLTRENEGFGHKDWILDFRELDW